MPDQVSSSDQAQGDWKDKYLHTISVLEQKQEEHQTLILMLQRYVIRVMILAQDTQASITTCLDSAKLSLKDEGLTTDVLQKHVDALDKALQNTESEEVSVCSSVSGLEVSYHRLVQLLKKQDIAKSLHRKIKSFSEKLDQCDVDNSPNLLHEFSVLLELFLENTKKNKKSSESKNLWKRLLKSDEQSKEKSQELFVEPFDGQESTDLSSTDVENDQLRYKAFQILHTLIDHIILPEEFEDRKRPIVENFKKNICWEKLPDLLNETKELVVISNSTTRKELEDFLIGLNHKLNDLHGSLDKSLQAEGDAIAAAKNFDQKIKKTIGSLQEKVERSTSLENLKRDAFGQIDEILSAIDYYRKHESSQRDLVLTELEKLSKRMASMEEKSDSLKLTIESQRENALKDSLTDLPNRRAYEEQGEREISRVYRYNSNLSLVVADIDYFKKINDEYGHLAGDKVLKLVAKSLGKHLRVSDFVARYGGEEFVILMPETVLEDAITATEKLRLAIKNTPFHYQNIPVPITMSFGITQIKDKNDTLEHAFSRADEALYRAKARGRDQVCLAN